MHYPEAKQHFGNDEERKQRREQYVPPDGQPAQCRGKRICGVQQHQQHTAGQEQAQQRSAQLFQSHKQRLPVYG
ncbi:hypothetical protein D3C86_2188280 [compost metagenome]